MSRSKVLYIQQTANGDFVGVIDNPNDNSYAFNCSPVSLNIISGDGQIQNFNTQDDKVANMFDGSEEDHAPYASYVDKVKAAIEYVIENCQPLTSFTTNGR